MFSIIAFVMNYRRDVEDAQRTAVRVQPKIARKGANDVAAAPVARAA